MRYKYFITLCIIFGIFSVRAHHNTDSLILESKSLNNDSVKIIVYHKLSIILSEQYPDSAIYYINKGLELAEKRDDPYSILRLYNALGNILNYKGEIDSAMAIFQNNLTVSTNLDYSIGIISAYSNIGLIYKQKGRYPDALKYFYKGVKESEDRKEFYFIKILYTNIGNVYAELNDNTKAFDSFKKALKNYESSQAPEVSPYLYNALGRTYLKMNKYDSAMYYYQLGLASIDKFFKPIACTFLNRSIGELYLVKNQTDSAYKYLNKSINIALRNKNKNEIVKTLNSLGQYHIKNNEVNKSIQVLRKSISLANEIQAIAIIKSSSVLLSENFETLNQIDSALKYYKLSVKMNDSIQSEEKIKTMMKLSMEFEYAKEQREKKLLQAAELKKQKIIRNFSLIALFFTLIILAFVYRFYKLKKRSNNLLHKKNLLIEEQKEELLTLNKTRDKFFAIISHDLKGPFNSLIGFSSLLLKKYGGNLDSKAKYFVTIIHESSKNLNTLLDNLLQWARLKEKKIKVNIECIDIQPLIIDTVEVLKINALNKQITIHNKSQSDLKAQTDPNLVTFIIRNILNNAIKFTNEEGDIWIATNINNNKVTIEIKDNGVGIHSERIKELFKEESYSSTKGTDGEKGSGLGLVLCKEFAELLQANIRVESRIGKGSTFYVDIPICQ